MDFLSFLLDLLKTTLAFVLGTIISMVITGLMINYFVVQKILKNKDLQDIVKLIRQVKDALTEHNGKDKKDGYAG